MQKLFGFTLAMGSFLAVSSAAIAADGGWQMPNLGPFGSQPPTSTRAAPPTSGWKMPKLWPQAKVQPKRRAANPPTTWNRMTSGTQNMFNKTADALTPWDNKKSAPPPRLTGTNSIFTQSGATHKTTQKKDDAVKPASWWSSDKKEDKPKTVTGFLSQPRP